MTLDKLLEVIYKNGSDTIDVDAGLFTPSGVGNPGNYEVLTLKIGSQTFKFNKSSGNWEQDLG